MNPTPPSSHRKAMDATEALVAQQREQHQRKAKLTHLADGTIKHASGATARPVQDGWANLLTGIGTTRDKRMGNKTYWNLTPPEEEVEQLYAGDTTARRIVELLPNEALREGIKWENELEGSKWDDELLRLQAWPKFHEAWTFARLYGGSGILLNDGVTPVEKLDTPLKDLNQLQSLVVLSRWELWAYATDLQRDITKPAFSLPNYYRIYPRMTFGQTAIRVHASRIIRFDGRRLPRLLHIRNNFWGDSVLTALQEVLGDFKVSSSNIASVLHDFRLLVHQMNGLSDAINSGHEADVRRKFELMDLARSVLGSYVIDKDDEMQFHSASLAGVAELVDRVKQRLQAETDIPHTVLFNEAPGGARSMGSSGASEEKGWFNYVHAEQEKYLRPRLDQLFQVLARQTKTALPTEDGKAPDYDFNPLWQMDDLAKADMELKHAQADQIYLDLAVRTPNAVQVQRFPEEAAELPAEGSFVKPVEPTPPPFPGAPKPGEEVKPEEGDGEAEE